MQWLGADNFSRIHVSQYCTLLVETSIEALAASEGFTGN